MRPRKVWVTDVPRREDEIVLARLALRSGGMSAGRIAKLTGVRESVVDMSTRRALEADLRESGEDPRKVREAYWRPAPGRW